MAIIPLKSETCQAATTPIKRSNEAITAAFLSGTIPLGIGLSGLSTRSNPASKTSLKATPPPYRPMVDRQSHSQELSPGLGPDTASGENHINAAPDTAIPAKISATAVTTLAGRVRRK